LTPFHYTIIADYFRKKRTFQIWKSKNMFYIISNKKETANIPEYPARVSERIPSFSASLRSSVA
ncbi:MAG: hypothetical protein IK115_12315, partial [Lachnospiraceae bacterium]|nr:hypothetical protein [Lachnospiraceae bacterium]